ncbi:thermonuclease family protein [Roseibium algae]|uniref:Thermonuclease family protein n=1 Tax=Roseibium algae TaxID=3123038 RepID=A0ABU8TGU0_9HYPH
MQLRPFLVPLLLLNFAGGSVAFLLLAEPPAPPVRPKPSHEKVSTADTAISKATPDLVAGLSREIADVPLPNQLRNVSPEGVTAPQITAPLTRVAPSKRYLELKDPPVKALPDGPLELRRPQVLDAGTLRTEDLTVRIAYVNALKADETCVSRLGGLWPCGARARTALRGLVRIYTITCDKVDDLGPREISAVCSRRTISLGSWLVQYGWADPSEDAPEEYRELAQAARDQKIGKWQSEWRVEPSTEPSAELRNETNLEDLLPGLADLDLGSDSPEPYNPFDIPADTDVTQPSNFGADPIAPATRLQDLPPLR